MSTYRKPRLFLRELNIVVQFVANGPTQVGLRQAVPLHWLFMIVDVSPGWG
jgi:hypothetical protein